MLSLGWCRPQGRLCVLRSELSCSKRGRFRRFCKGVTLVEILVTLGIAAALVSLLLPGLGIKERADRAKCSSNMRTLGVAFQLYAQDNDLLGPPDGRDRGNLGMGKWQLGGQKVLFGCLFPYLSPGSNRSRVIFCPGTPLSRKTVVESESSLETSYWMIPDVTSNSARTRKLFTLPSRRVAIMDYCYWWNVEAKNNHKTLGFNVFRLDGSISWIAKEAVEDIDEWDWAAMDNL